MRKKILIPAVCAALAVLICAGIFWYLHPTHWKFNDHFVLGSTQAEIVARYGPCHAVRYDTNGDPRLTYMVRDDTPELVMGYDNSLWYDIRFENGVAAEVSLRKGYFGG